MPMLAKNDQNCLVNLVNASAFTLLMSVIFIQSSRFLLCIRKSSLFSSVPDPGSGAFLTPDPEKNHSGSRIPRPYFEELFDNFFGKKFYNS